jgi:hypothetical protein
MIEAIRLYCGVNEAQWNHHPVAPGSYACIAPVYGKTTRTKQVNRVALPSTTHVLQDSGAFSDGPGHRLCVEAALERQLAHAERFGYREQIEAIASYDRLIDEKWNNSIRRKARWSEADAWDACQETIHAARYLSTHRPQGMNVVLSAQGVSAQQYLLCTQQIVPYLHPGDIFGLGGWCITGKLPAIMMPVLRATMQQVIPFVGREGVARVHVWGVCYTPALGELLWLCDEAGIRLSTDSSGPQLRPCMGEWGYGSWRDASYQRPEPMFRGSERARHVQCTREWLANFREREPHWYRFVPLVPHTYTQLNLLEEVSA